MAVPLSLGREISPPPTKKRAYEETDKSTDGAQKDKTVTATPAAIEAGKARIRNHLDHFCSHLGAVIRHGEPSIHPLLPISEFATLYQRNQRSHGHHFVIHQHNHPIAGVHYDLRLQFSSTSTISFAIPYGLPGNPNSRRQGRLAIETRVHNLWNNLIESASHATGSLLVWDTGEYEILDRKMKKAGPETDEEESEQDENGGDGQTTTPENEKLIQAFQTKYIRLRLRGHILPDQYTITLRLPSTNSGPYNQPKAPPRKRRRKAISTVIPSSPSTTDSEDAITVTGDQEDNSAVADASDDEAEMDNIRSTNAYPGAKNSIGSVHQRHWFVSLDKTNSGLVKGKSGVVEGMWVAAPGKSFKPFFIQGAEVEKSIITGRTSEEVMIDEGVEGFVARKRWRPVMD